MDEDQASAVARSALTSLLPPQKGSCANGATSVAAAALAGDELRDLLACLQPRERAVIELRSASPGRRPRRARRSAPGSASAGEVRRLEDLALSRVRARGRG